MIIAGKKGHMEKIKEKFIQILHWTKSGISPDADCLIIIRDITKEALALIEAQEQEDKFTVKVKIPELNQDKTCSIFCPLRHKLENGYWTCAEQLHFVDKYTVKCKPGIRCPQCPRGEPK